MNDFYEEDEPVTDVVAAFDAAEKGLTAPPTAGVFLYACPTCRTPTTPVQNHPALCLPCTEAEIGMTVAELRTRVSDLTQKGRKRKWKA